MQIAFVWDGAECYNSRGSSRLSYCDRRWMQQVRPKHWYLSARGRGRTSQKMMSVLVNSSKVNSSKISLNPSVTNVIYIYGAPILDVSRSHTTTQHSR
jgi:hypothetical protein